MKMLVVMDKLKFFGDMYWHRHVTAVYLLHHHLFCGFRFYLEV